MAEVDDYGLQYLVCVGIVIGYFLIKSLVYKCVIQYKKKTVWRFIGLFVILIAVLILEIVGFCVEACITEDYISRKEQLEERKNKELYIQGLLKELNSSNEEIVIQAINRGLTLYMDSWSKARVIEKLKEMAGYGNSDAQYWLGLYYDGYDFIYGIYDKDENYIDRERSAYWYLQAANQGNSKAQYVLAKKYEKGEGAKCDLEKSLQLIIQSAENKNSYAWLYLGDLYRDGVKDYNKGTILEKNIVLAKDCWRKAIELGNEDIKCKAEKRLEKIYD